MTWHPIAIIGDGRIVTRDGARPYPTLAILHCMQLATIALTEGAPLGALWLQPGSDVARAARDASFWQPAPGWRIFQTGVQGGVVGYATIRRDGADVHGAARREVAIFADLPGRWRLGADFSGADGARRLLETVLCAEWALREGLATIWTDAQYTGEIAYSPAHTALDLLARLCKTDTRSTWLAPLSAGTLADLPWPRPITPMHVNRQPRDGKYVHIFDKNGAYIAAMSRRFGRGEPVHVTRPDHALCQSIVEGKVYGMWRVDGYPEHDAINLPEPFGTAESAVDDLWVYSPHVELARKLGWYIEIHEGYYWPNTHGALAEWATTLWQARLAARKYANHAPSAEAFIKSCFTESLGVMERRPDVDAGETIKWYNRPDWAGMITAEHYLRHTLRLHQLARIQTFEGQHHGYLYVSGKDSFGWIADDPNPATAVLGLLNKPETPQTQLGSYKHVATLSGSQAQEVISMAREGAPLVQITSAVMRARRGIEV